VADVDTNYVGDQDPFCPLCIANECTSWELPASFVGHLYLSSPDTNKIFLVQIVQDCRYLLFDTCARLRPLSNGAGFVIGISVTGNSQVYVCGNTGDTVVIACKITPPPQPRLDSILLDLATCMPPVGIEQPIKACNDTKYYDILRCAHVSVPNRASLPRGIYWEWKFEMSVGRKVFID